MERVRVGDQVWTFDPKVETLVESSARVEEMVDHATDTMLHQLDAGFSYKGRKLTNFEMHILDLAAKRDPRYFVEQFLRAMDKMLNGDTAD